MKLLDTTSNRASDQWLRVRGTLASVETSNNTSRDSILFLPKSVRAVTTDVRARPEDLSQVLVEISWLIEARSRIERRARDIYGESTLVWFKPRFDSRRDPTDYQVAYIYAPRDITVEELIDGEDRLVDYLVDSLHDVEQHFVVVCHRGRPKQKSGDVRSP